MTSVGFDQHPRDFFNALRRRPARVAYKILHDGRLDVSPQLVRTSATVGLRSSLNAARIQALEHGCLAHLIMVETAMPQKASGSL